MATINIPDFMVRESGRLVKDILQKSLYASPWLTLMEQTSFPRGLGYSPSITTFGRTLPATTYTDGGAITNPAYAASGGFADKTADNLGSDSVNNCAPNTIMLKMGNKKVPFTLQNFALESQRICANDLFVAFDGARQIEAIKNNLAFNTTFVLTEKFRRDFVYWVDNKVVVTTNGTTTKTSAGGLAGADTFNMTGTNAALKTAGAGPPAKLTQALLDKWLVKLGLAGAGPTALTQDDGAATYALLISPEMSWQLKTETEVRQDFRYNHERSDDLLKALNAKSAPIKGFQHIIDMTVPRWNWSAQDGWAKVEPYIITASPGGGWQADENPAYDEAAWEDTIIFNKAVVEEAFPGSVTNVGGTDFMPINYRGEWGWRGYLSDDNKDGQIGYFRGVFELGAIPRYTGYGAVIRHARCGPGLQYTVCA